MSKTIGITYLNTSKASDQIKDYICDKQPEKIEGCEMTYRITIKEAKENFKKLSSVYRLLRANNADQVLFYVLK